MLCRDGKLSLYCFLAAAIFAVLPEILLEIELRVYHKFFQNVWIVHIFQYALLNVLIFILFRGFSYRVATASTFLGYVFGAGILAYLTSPPTWQILGLYFSVLATFHYTEFLVIAWTNPEAMSIDTFMLSHSSAYTIAACSSWLEFIVERHFLPSMKLATSISYFGLILCLGGEVIRKLAIFTAKKNFNHLVQNEKREGHQLVTHGIYSICRHPSYVGWFYWSIGTQLILQNPFCAMAYAVTSWKFFHNRISIEEVTLMIFFGREYVEYQKNVCTGLPFITGYKLDS